ncbi:MAG: S8 family serine peptidase, partial [Bacteroidota bacterium]
MLASFMSAIGQIELNVKLYPGNQALQQFLQSDKGTGSLAKSLPAGLAQNFPFLQKVQKAQGFQTDPRKKGISPELDVLFSLTFDENGNNSSLINQLRSSGAFEFVEENRTMQLHDSPHEIIPTDDSLSSQWYHSFIQSFEAWEYTKGSPNIKIGVIDTGLDYDHPEFTGQYLVNSLEDANANGSFEPWPSTEQRNGVSGDFDGLDNDNNGFIDDVSGYDFTDQPRNPVGGDYLFPDPNPTDDNNHGTMVSGVIFAKHDNTFGGAGLAPDCKLLPIRAFGPSGAGEDDDIARSIIYAADQGVQILNFSFGDIYPSLMVHEAIKYAYNKGIVMVSSAGNARGDDLHYPSGFNEVISVSASTADLESGREFLFPLSSYGLTVDLCAPGAGIFTPIPRDTSMSINESFIRTQGTSFSAPMVAATIALLFAKDGIRTPQQIRGILTSSADDLSDPGWDHLTGAGRLNILRALQVVGASHVELISPENDRGSDKNEVFIIGTVLDPEFEKYHIEYQVGTEDDNPWIPILADQVYQTDQDTLARWDLTDLAEGEYT